MSRKKVLEEEKETVTKNKKTKKETVKEEKVVKKKVTKKEPEKKVKEEIKEEKVTKQITKTKKSKDTALLPSKDQKTLRVLSRIVSVAAKVLRICSMIIVPIIAIIALIIPIVLSKVEVDGNIVRMDDVRFVLSNNYITANVANKSYVLSDNVSELDKIVDYLNSNSITKILAGIELSLIFAIIGIIINIYLLKYVEDLFNNFYSQKTPFTEENSNYIYRIGRMMIYSLVASMIFEFVLSFFIQDVCIANFGVTSIVMIIVVYIMHYIFKYAAKLQEKTETSIYD